MQNQESLLSCVVLHFIEAFYPILSSQCISVLWKGNYVCLLWIVRKIRRLTSILIGTLTSILIGSLRNLLCKSACLFFFNRAIISAELIALRKSPWNLGVKSTWFRSVHHLYVWVHIPKYCFLVFSIKFL